MLKAFADKALRRGGSMLRGGFVLALALSAALPAQARGPAPQQALPAITVAELPPQGRTTYALIFEGGPFPFDKDGTVFGNRERILPRETRGFYREYTVKTPRSRDRGARRIVCGGLAPQQPEACYYTSDHYSSFSKITP